MSEAAPKMKVLSIYKDLPCRGRVNTDSGPMPVYPAAYPMIINLAIVEVHAEIKRRVDCPALTTEGQKCAASGDVFEKMANCPRRIPEEEFSDSRQLPKPVQLDLLADLGKGMTVPEISSKKLIDPDTLRSRLVYVKRRLNVEGTNSAIRRVEDAGLLDPWTSVEETFDPKSQILPVYRRILEILATNPDATFEKIAAEMELPSSYIRTLASRKNAGSGSRNVLVTKAGIMKNLGLFKQ